MSDDVTKLEAEIADLRCRYDEAARALLKLYEGRSKKEDRLAAFNAWCEAGTALFNANERFVAVGSRVGAVDDPTWYTAQAENAAGILEVIHRHYETLFTRAADLKLTADHYRPNRTAFAGLQRLVRTTNPALAQQIRDDFVRGGLPTHGFDTDESGHSSSARYNVSPVEKVVAYGTIALVVPCVLYAALRDRPFADPNQVVLLRTLLSFAVAALGGVVPGFMHVGLNLWGLAIRASGAAGFFVISYLCSPTVLLLPAPPPAPTAVNPTPALDDVEVVDVGFAEHEGEARAPRLDVKLANRGTRSAYVKRVNVAVKQVWRLPSWTTVGVVVPPSHEYVLNLKPTGAPYVAALPVSHGLKPDEFDRFTVQLQEEPWPSSNTIYLADIEIVTNGSDQTFRKADVLFLITQAGAAFPTEAALAELVRGQKDLGRRIDPAEVRKALKESKAMILEAARRGRLKSPSVRHLIESATSSDIE